MTKTESSVLDQIDALLANTDPSQQDILVAMREGRLTRDQLRGLASQYFHLIDSLPRFVTMVHSVTTKHPEIRRALLNIAVAMELRPPSISDLWLQTCAALGLFSDTVREAEPTTSTSVCLSDFEYLCQAGSAQGIAALYAWMSRLPRVCRIEQAALREHYDLADGPGVQFFDIVGLQAESHAKALRSALEQLLRQYPEAEFAAVDAAHSAISAVQGMYTGVLAGTTA